MAVYTEVTDEELASFIAGYGLGALVSYKGIAEGVENTNYLVRTTAGTYILTLYEKRVARADLPFFLGLMEHLARAGVACPTPLRNSAGESLSELAGRAAALVTFLDGLSVRRPRPEHCSGVGRTLAELHLASAGFLLRRPNALGIDGWRPLFARFSSRASEIAAGLDTLIGAELELLEERWPRGLAAGIIHADLFPDNVFFLGPSLSGLIDFYFACNDALAYDVAICLNAWCFESDFSFNITKGRALLAGYEQVRPLSPAEREALPMLARGAAMRFLLTRSYDWLHTSKDALVSPHNPIDYLRRLRFHQSVTSATDYGLGGAA
ncbi:MAG: homoserine kinase [Hyphomicrobium sp.]